MSLPLPQLVFWFKLWFSHSCRALLDPVLSLEDGGYGPSRFGGFGKAPLAIFYCTLSWTPYGFWLVYITVFSPYVPAARSVVLTQWSEIIMLKKRLNKLAKLSTSMELFLARHTFFTLKFSPKNDLRPTLSFPVKQAPNYCTSWYVSLTIVQECSKQPPALKPCMFSYESLIKATRKIG